MSPRVKNTPKNREPEVNVNEVRPDETSMSSTQPEPKSSEVVLEQNQEEAKNQHEDNNNTNGDNNHEDEHEKSEGEAVKESTEENTTTKPRRQSTRVKPERKESNVKRQKSLRERRSASKPTSNAEPKTSEKRSSSARPSSARREGSQMKIKSPIKRSLVKPRKGRQFKEVDRKKRRLRMKETAAEMLVIEGKARKHPKLTELMSILDDTTGIVELKKSQFSLKRIPKDAFLKMVGKISQSSFELKAATLQADGFYTVALDMKNSDAKAEKKGDPKRSTSASAAKTGKSSTKESSGTKRAKSTEKGNSGSSGQADGSSGTNKSVKGPKQKKRKVYQNNPKKHVSRADASSKIPRTASSSQSKKTK